MSDGERWAAISELERSVALDASALCTPLSSVPASPIDEFYTDIASLIPVGKPDDLRSNSGLGKVLLLGLVAASEHYFRAMLSGLVFLCPLARKRAATQQLAFGAIGYYAEKDLGLSLLEHVSLATAGEVQKQTQRLLGIELARGSSVAVALQQYEKLCQLRHAAAHAQGHLGHQNLQELGVTIGPGQLGIRVDFTGFQLAAAVCQNLVRAYNRYIYRKTIERWMGEKVLRGSWADDSEQFGTLFALCHSRRDSVGPSNAYQAYRNLAPILRRRMAEGRMPVV